MYLNFRANGQLESWPRSGHTESLVEFLDRFLGQALRPVLVSPVVEETELLPATPGSAGVTPRPGKRGTNRDVPTLDGQHTHTKVESPQKRAKKDGGEYRKAKKGTCMVCKRMGRRMRDAKKGYPQTESHCYHCGGFVHGQDTNGYGDCWGYHLANKVKGLHNSGDMAPPASAVAETAL